MKQKELPKIKLCMDLEFVHCGDGLLANMIVQTIPKPDNWAGSGCEWAIESLVKPNEPVGVLITEAIIIK